LPDDKGGEIAGFGIRHIGADPRDSRRESRWQFGHKVFGDALMRDAGIMTVLTYSAASPVIEQALTGPHMGELNRLLANLYVASDPARHGEPQVARSPGSGKSERKCAPREFSRRLAASANDPAYLAEGAQVEPDPASSDLNARSLTPMPVASSSVLDRVERAQADRVPPHRASRRHHPTSVSNSFSPGRSSFRSVRGERMQRA